MARRSRHCALPFSIPHDAFSSTERGALSVGCSSQFDDAFGTVTTETETFSNGWRNPDLYDGRDLVRYDGETGLYWMSVRAYQRACA